jgi:hypothetical protein
VSMFLSLSAENPYQSNESQIDAGWVKGSTLICYIKYNKIKQL